MSIEIIQSVAYDNYDDFNIRMSDFHKFSFHYILGLFNDKTNLRIKYLAFYTPKKIWVVISMLV
jgi:hypothetical protein